jgi:carboxyl-terminal processing protease
MMFMLVLGFVVGITLDRAAAEGFGSLDAAADFRLIPEAWKIIQDVYVDRAAVQPQALSHGALSGMVDALGDTGHGRFLSPEMVKALRKLQQNKLEGVGAEIQIKAGHVVVVAPLDDSPAQRAGLRSGDVILRVAGHDVAGLPPDQVVARISGNPGTSVTLTILNPSSGQSREVALVRASITVHGVTWQQSPGTGVAHLRIASFGRGMTADLRAALAQIRRSGLSRIVLDMRNNPGGLLEEAVGAASQFLAGGNVLLVKDAHGKIKPIPVKPGGAATTIPLAVLVNGGTASAAEIVAGALRDANRAKLVGVRTIGTGTVLNEFPMSDGSALLLAVEEWLTPAGRVIWHRGITPEIVVELPPGTSQIFPQEERGMTATQLNDSRDTQILTALELLSPPGVSPVV